jgi:hypothetical protein
MSLMKVQVLEAYENLALGEVLVNQINGFVTLEISPPMGNFAAVTLTPAMADGLVLALQENIREAGEHDG